jgi:uncharacterized protein (TIGR02001 family)
MKKLHKIIAASLLASASTAGTGVALAESPLTANVGVTSNYIWRGVTQTNDTSAVSGGIDYAHDSGFYLGTWASNLDGGQYEQDIYAGYGFKAGPVDMDVGYIKYMYPVDAAVQLDFDELYVNAAYKMFSAGVALTMSKEAGGAYEDDVYMYVGAEFEVKEGLTLGLTYGDYDIDEAAGGTSDYSHMQVSLSKGDFTFAYDDTDQTVVRVIHVFLFHGARASIFNLNFIKNMACCIL